MHREVPVKRALLLIALAGCSSTPKMAELCHNGIDDDGNGLSDCLDPACANDTGCQQQNTDSGYYGTCPKCGQICADQTACLHTSYAFDNPLAACSSGHCQSFATGIVVAMQLDTLAYTGLVAKLQSMNTRFVSASAADGSPVDCAALAAAAPGKTSADAAQIETSGKFNLVGYDVAKVNANAGDIVLQPFMNVSTGGNYVLWVELWAGPPDTNTKLPTGNRLGWGCFDSGALVAPIVETDNCDPTVDAGNTCRQFHVVMPAPQ
jgi:hypothetical protein